MQSPSTEFDILIPVITSDSNSDPFLYLGYTEKDPTTGRIYNRYIENRKQFSQTGGYSSTGIYGPDLNAKMLGETVTNMKILADKTGITPNSAALWGAAFLYFS